MPLIAPAATLDRLEQANQLPFLDAFCNEVMRLKPVATNMALETVEDTEMLGCLMPRGTKLFVLLRYVATREEHFAGGDHFDPERWLPPARRPWATPSPRPGVCPLWRRGRGSARAATSPCWKSVRSSPCSAATSTCEPVGPGREVKEKMAVVMRPDHLHLRLRRRSLNSSVSAGASKAMAASRSDANPDCSGMS